MPKVVGIYRKKHFCFVREVKCREYYTVEETTEEKALKVLEESTTPLRACIHFERGEAGPFKRFKRGE